MTTSAKTPTVGDVFVIRSPYNVSLTKSVVKRVTPSGLIELADEVDLWCFLHGRWEQRGRSGYSSYTAIPYSPEEHDPVFEEQARRARAGAAMDVIRSAGHALHASPLLEQAEALAAAIKAGRK